MSTLHQHPTPTVSSEQTWNEEVLVFDGVETHVTSSKHVKIMDILGIKVMDYRKQTLIRDNFILQLTCDKWFVITIALQCKV